MKGSFIQLSIIKGLAANNADDGVVLVALLAQGFV